MHFLSRRYGNNYYHYDLNDRKIKKTSLAARGIPRIGLIIDSPLYSEPINGMTYKVLSLSKALQKIGYSYTFFVCNRNFKNIAEVERLKIEGIKIHILSEDIFYNVDHMSTLIKDENIEVLQYETAQIFASIGIDLKHKTAIPTLLVLHDIEAELFTQMNFSKSSIQNVDYLHYISSHFADAIATLTTQDKEWRVANHDIPQEKIFVTPIGADSRIKYQPKFLEKTIGFLGNQFYEPNRRAVIFLIEEVFPIILKNMRGVKLKIIGDTPQDLIKKYIGNPSIMFTGQVCDEEEYLSEISSLFVGTCCIDSGTGMNTKISNYCASGIPVVLSPLAAKGYEEIKSLIITPFDKDKIATKILQILDDISYAKNIGAENRKLLLEHLSWAKVSKNMTHAIEYAIQTTKLKDPEIIEVQESKLLSNMRKSTQDDLLKGHYISDPLNNDQCKESTK